MKQSIGTRETGGDVIENENTPIRLVDGLLQPIMLMYGIHSILNVDVVSVQLLGEHFSSNLDLRERDEKQKLGGSLRSLQVE